MNFSDIFSLIGLVVSIMCSVAIFCGLLFAIKDKKQKFNLVEQFFSNKVKVENFYLSDKKYTASLILNFVYLYIPLLAVIPSIFLVIWSFSFESINLLWLIGYLLQYTFAACVSVWFFKKDFVDFSKKIEQSKYDYNDLKKIAIEIQSNYSFKVVSKNTEILRSKAFSHNFKLFEKKYFSTTDSFKQYKILLLMLGRFCNLINTLEAQTKHADYCIHTSTNEELNCTKSNLIEQVLLTLQSIMHQKQANHV